MTEFNMDGFGEYGNNTSEKAVTSGDAAKHIHGNTYTYQMGDANGKQIGNKNTFQHGYSNTLTEGMTFTTSLAATFSTTVGVAVSTTCGASITSVLGDKVALFRGREFAYNESEAVKVTSGSVYTFDTVEKMETTAQKIESTGKTLVISNGVKKVINDEISAYATNLTIIAGGAVTETIGSRNITCLESCTLTAPAMTLNGPTSLTATTGGDLTLTSGTALKMLGGTSTMSFLGIITIG